MEKMTSIPFPQGFYSRGSCPQKKDYPSNFYVAAVKQAAPIDYPQNFYRKIQVKFS